MRTSSPDSDDSMADTVANFQGILDDIPVDVMDNEADWIDSVDTSHVATLWSTLLSYSCKRMRAYSGDSRTTEWRRGQIKRQHKQAVWDGMIREARPPPPSSVLRLKPVESVSAVDGVGVFGETQVHVSPAAACPPTVAPPAAVAECDYADDLSENEDNVGPRSDAECLERLDRDNVASTSCNVKFDSDTNYDHLRFLCVRRFFEHRCEGDGKMVASMKAAEIMRRVPTAHLGLRIRQWASEYSISGSLPEIMQGKHAKSASFIDDDDRKIELRTLLRCIPRNLRTAAAFADKVNSAYSELEVSVSTACRWMHLLGFHPQSLKSKIYTDGHERPDVLEYRDKFIAQMESFQARMTGYSGPDLLIAHPAADTENPRILVINHDEVSFDSAAGRQRPWVEEGHTPMLPKRGQCIMLSGFLSPECVESFKTIEPSSDGWWTNRDLIEQLNELLPVLMAKYPGVVFLFQFDNSGNHSAMAPDALVASRLNLGDGFPKLSERDRAAGMEPVAMRDTHFIRDGVRVKQTMTYINAAGVLCHKGIKSIVQERGGWRGPAQEEDIIRTFCADFSLAKMREINVDHSEPDPAKRREGPNMVKTFRLPEMQLDEAREWLENQPDFFEQQQHNWIAETVERHGHLAIFGPKFHPELAPIELLWSDIKKFLRAHCDYTIQTLRANIPAAFASITVTACRRYFAHVARYMRAYSKGTLSLAQVEWAMRKYTSHRRAKEASPDLDVQFLAEGWFADMPASLREEGHA